MALKFEAGMDESTASLPRELREFIDAGGRTIRDEYDDWSFRIASRGKNAFGEGLPASAVAIAKNECGDCLFLISSARNALSRVVYVFRHEEDRWFAYASDFAEIIERMRQ